MTTVAENLGLGSSMARPLLAFDVAFTFAADPEHTRIPKWGYNSANFTFDVYISYAMAT